MYLKNLLKERKLPVIPQREEILKILQENEFGYLPPLGHSITVSEPQIIETRISAGTVIISTVKMRITTKYGSHSFSVLCQTHNDGQKHPFFVFLNFHPGIASLYYPAEEIADNGFDVFSVYYKDVTSDDGDFKNGLARILLPDGQKTDTDCGKIGIWAFAAMKVLDYALTLPSSDSEQAAILGHSRLGKTALFAGMLDTRFKYVFSNDSGCFGASLNRGNTGLFKERSDRKRGELITDITDHFAYWFCKGALKHRKTNIPEKFDQHFLLASIAPRFVYVASADMDYWADPDSEFLSCVAASEAFEKQGLPGFIHKDALPLTGETFHEGRIGYHKRHGLHFLSRNDWNKFMKFINKHQ